MDLFARSAVSASHRHVETIHDENTILKLTTVEATSELDEILSLSDRILVMFEGKVVAEFDASKGPVDRNAVGLAMAGSAPEKAA